jgi:fatty-acyl-CoA synthase
MYAHPAIFEACVIGVPDAKRGEDVMALVVLKESGQEQPSEPELISWCREQMAVYKAPRKIRFVDFLPKSNTGKIMWRELQELEKIKMSEKTEDIEK